MDRPSREVWVNTTHDWSADVDKDHLAEARRSIGDIGVAELVHLILEVLAYADDEAEAQQRLESAVVRISENEVAISDDGRGTDTRRDADGGFIRKPVMATKDLRFYDSDSAPCLPDGLARRGMSTVAAACSELVHENRRRDGAWVQTYRYGIPSAGLEPLTSWEGTGTTVKIRGIAEHVIAAVDPSVLQRLTSSFTWITVAVDSDGETIRNREVRDDRKSYGEPGPGSAPVHRQGERHG